MTAAETINCILAIGAQIDSGATQASMTPNAFLSSTQFQNVHKTVHDLARSLKSDDIEGAIAAVQKREKDLLRGRELMDLPTDELIQFHALSATEHQLVVSLLKNPPGTPSFLAILVNDVLPVLTRVAKTILHLLK